MRVFRKAVLIILVLCSCVGCDQVTKTIARDHLSTSRPLYLADDVFRLEYIENVGAFLSLGASLPESVRFWLLIVCVGAVLIGILRYIWVSQEMTPLGTLGGALIVGGGFSNLIDRALNDGVVVDFMNIGIGALRTGIFNVADLAIMAGIGMLLVSHMRFDKGKAIKT